MLRHTTTRVITLPTAPTKALCGCACSRKCFRRRLWIRKAAGAGRHSCVVACLQQIPDAQSAPGDRCRRSTLPSGTMMSRLLPVLLLVVSLLLLLVGQLPFAAADPANAQPHCIACPVCPPCTQLENGVCREIFGCTK
ncbi:uncharacterized protein LOC127001989 [Eriocheir sinensis]|uniref:uncharacterized protein LOC127001989 n=1 Tax=Eriocheir sinensis TaxID=95602 RepID=UPI0021C5DD9C|nr:uncharacterized protein LOC127001989 [Eriocheir sinensis]